MEHGLKVLITAYTEGNMLKLHDNSETPRGSAATDWIFNELYQSKLKGFKDGINTDYAGSPKEIVNTD